jgi:Ran GTPase-activating protein (RanGAP) involved in mRNA processing and transport
MDKMETVSFKLGGNRITNKGAVNFLKKVRPSCRELDFSNNKIGTEGVHEINSLLLAHSKILHLNLENNGLGDKAVSFLLKNQIQNSSLLKLNLSKNNISDFLHNDLFHFLKGNDVL